MTTSSQVCTYLAISAHGAAFVTAAALEKFPNNDNGICPGGVEVSVVLGGLKLSRGHRKNTNTRITINTAEIADTIANFHDNLL